MPEWILDTIKAIILVLLGGVGVEIFKKQANRKKETLELTNLKTQGTKLIIETQTNINQIVEESTERLSKQIADNQSQINKLKNAIAHSALEKVEDDKKHAEEMFALNERLDIQIKRNNELIDVMQKEIELRTKCFEQLQQFAKKMNELTAPPDKQNSVSK